MTQTATTPAGRRINRSTLYFFGASGRSAVVLRAGWRVRAVRTARSAVG